MDMIEDTKQNKRRRDSIIRRDDRVIIRNPVIVVRVGYPMDPLETAMELRHKYGERVNELLKHMGIRDKLPALIPENRPSRTERDINQIFRACASLLMREKRFGGDERSLHTREWPEIKDTESYVSEIKHVKTGIRYPAYSGYDSYSGEYDYEPGGLENMKSHKLLRLYAHIDHKFAISSQDFWIEATNCEKIFYT